MACILPVVYHEVYVKENVAIRKHALFIYNDSLVSLLCSSLAILLYFLMNYLKVLNVTLVSFHKELACAKKILLNQKITRNWSREIQ